MLEYKFPKFINVEVTTYAGRRSHKLCFLNTGPKKSEMLLCCKSTVSKYALLLHTAFVSYPNYLRATDD